MSLTRANLEVILVKRCGALMTFAGLAVTVVGANDDLSDPLAAAMRASGYELASPVTVADGAPVAFKPPTLPASDPRWRSGGGRVLQ